MFKAYYDSPYKRGGAPTMLLLLLLSALIGVHLAQIYGWRIGPPPNTVSVVHEDGVNQEAQPTSELNMLRCRVDDASNALVVLIRLFTVVVTLLCAGFGIGIWQTERIARRTVREEYATMKDDEIDPSFAEREARIQALFECYGEHVAAGFDVILNCVTTAHCCWENIKLKQTGLAEDQLQEALRNWEKRRQNEATAFTHALILLISHDEDKIVNAAQQLGALTVPATRPYLEKALDFSERGSRKREAIRDALQHMNSQAAD